jgi:hypothetical protein
LRRESSAIPIQNSSGRARIRTWDRGVMSQKRARPRTTAHVRSCCCVRDFARMLVRRSPPVCVPVGVSVGVGKRAESRSSDRYPAVDSLGLSSHALRRCAEIVQDKCELVTVRWTTDHFELIGQRQWDSDLNHGNAEHRERSQSRPP